MPPDQDTVTLSPQLTVEGTLSKLRLAAEVRELQTATHNRRVASMMRSSKAKRGYTMRKTKNGRYGCQGRGNRSRRGRFPSSKPWWKALSLARSILVACFEVYRGWSREESSPTLFWDLVCLASVCSQSWRASSQPQPPPPAMRLIIGLGEDYDVVKGTAGRSL